MTNQNGNPKSSKDENEEVQLSPRFKFRAVMTVIFFILAVVYILWLIKLI